MKLSSFKQVICKSIDKNPVDEELLNISKPNSNDILKS